MTKELTILVVDDEEKIREGCRRVLEGNGYQVASAENGRVAMELLDTRTMDIILLDLKMPVMDGEQVLAEVQARYPDIPVIIITGHGTLDTAVECMKQGAYDFVTKPFQIRQFMATVDRAAEKRRLESEARRAQEENIRNLYDLNLEKSRLKTIINCLGNGVMVTNRNLEVVLHNPALIRMMGADEKIDTPAPLSRIMKDESISDTVTRIQSGQVPAQELVSQEIIKDNRYFRAITAAAPAPDGSVAGTVTVMEEITDFKQLDRMKSDFINMVAHELRTPLYSVKQLLGVQLDGLCGGLSEKQTDYLQRGVRQVDSLLDLIRDLLDISKAEAGMYVRHHVPVDLEIILREAIGVMEVRAHQLGLRFECRIPALPRVQADPKSIHEMFNNLLGNAINYSPDGGVVLIELRPLADHVEICISDPGIGIAPEELPKIFDKFYRIKHPKTRQVVGTGLGLSLVKNIVDAHRGSIDVESTPGRGTTFRVLLPVVK